MQTAYDFVRLAACRAPDRIAIVDDRTDRALDYAGLIHEVDRIAAGFATLGIGRGDLVATCLPNLWEHGLALLALARLGAVPALINARLKPEDAGRLIEQGHMKGAVLPAQDAMVGAARAALPANAPVVTVGGTVDGSIDFGDVRGDAAGLAAYARPHAEETAFVFYTSGTTGLPKGVELPHRVTDPRMLYMATQCGLTHGAHNRVLGLMPLFHVVGFYSVFLAALGLDGTYHVCSAFDPAAAVDAVVAKDITVLYGTPTHFHALLEAPNFAPGKMNGVTNLIYAGSAMSGPLLDRVRAAFANAKMVNIYGTTEIMNALYMPDPAGRPHTYRPGFYANVRVGRFGGSVHDEAPVGEDGELLVDTSADATFTRYLHRPDATAEKMVDGWYRTGDIAVKRPDGDLDVKGRVDDMVISGGENIYPEEVEGLLVRHEAVTECSVIGVPDQRWGEIVVACVVASAGTDQAALDDYLKASSLANYKRPRAYVFLDELPKNAAGKVLRRILREQAAVRDAG